MRVLVGFSTSAAPVSRFVERFTRSGVGRAFFILEDPDLGLLVYQAGPEGPRLTTMGDFEHDQRLVAAIAPSIDLTVAIRDSIRRYFVSEDGDHGLHPIRVAMGMTEKKLSARWEADFSRPNENRCSEFIVRTMQLAHYPSYPGAADLVAHETSPGELLAFMQSQQGVDRTHPGA